MKKYIIPTVCFFFFSCDHIAEEIIENSIKDKNKLVVSIKNDTPYIFKRTEIITKDGTVVFQIIDPGFYDISEQFLSIYDDIEIRIQTGSKVFYHKPIHYKEGSKVTKGRYTFIIGISKNDKLIIKRVKS